MVAAEEGNTAQPSYSVEKLTNADHLIFVPLQGEDEYEDIDMFWKRGQNNAVLQCFLNFAKESL